MTRKLTNQRLADIYAECEERDPAIVEIRAMIAELQEHRKAAMDCGPVGTFFEINGLFLQAEKKDENDFAVIPLYRHAQQPVVPEKATVGEMPFLGTSEGAYVRGWNDCRAAMLNGGAK